MSICRHILHQLTDYKVTVYKIYEPTFDVSVTQLVHFAMYKLAKEMCSWLFKAIVLVFSLLTLSKTESEITCPEGSEVKGKYGHLTTCCSPNHLPCGWAGERGRGAVAEAIGYFGKQA